MRSSTKLGVLVAAGSVAFPAVGSAQLFSPLDTVPKPNLVVGFDTSVTMNIDTGCNNCHSPGDPRTRLEAAKVDIRSTLPLFDPYFNLGYFQYRGCGSANVVDARTVLPSVDGSSNLGLIDSRINAATACNSKERRLPGATAGTSITPGGAGDPAVFAAFGLRMLPGFDPLAPFLHRTCAYTPGADGTPCTSGGTPRIETMSFNGGCYHHSDVDFTGTLTGPSCDFSGEVLAALQGELSAFAWPRWEETALDANQVRQEFCNPMRQIARRVRSALEGCFGTTDIPMMPRSEFNSIVNGNAFCDENVIAATACQGGALLDNTCICDDTIPLCEESLVTRSQCNTPMTFKARQQVAVCETVRPGTFYDFYQGQSDNVVNGGCRENAAALFTDGYMGESPGALAEAARAVPTYASSNPFGNMTVFRVANSFTSSANALMSAVTGGQLTVAADATNLTSMQSSFAALLNRMYRGNYTGASMTMDSYGSVAVATTFSVPGYRGVAQPTDTYLGWPMRLSLHEVGPDGTITNAPAWETDWATKAQPATSCYNEFYGPAEAPLSGAVRSNRGPDANFANGVARAVTIPAGQLERNNIAGNDNPQPVRFGRMYGTATTKPAIVERAASDVGGLRSASFATHLNAIRNRPRMIYTMGGGYVYGIHGGTPTTMGSSRRLYGYDHTVPDAGREVIRYAPAFVDSSPSTYTVSVNPLIPQPLTTGQLNAREVFVKDQGAGVPPRWRTVVVGAQGTAGRGMFAMDVTDPCAPNVLSEWILPSGSASNEPMVYDFPGNPALEPTARQYFQIPSVIVTDGLRGSGRLFAYNIANGALLSQVNLPGGESYPTEPVCVDVEGSGIVTHCYVVSERGRLVRVDVDAGSYSFGTVRDITPNTGPNRVDMSQVYSTRPAVFFGPDGRVNILYGSGDFQNLINATGGNAVYKVIDRDSRSFSIGGNRGEIDRSCGGSTPGVVNIGDERLLSPPIVSKGLVAWTTYRPGSNGCVAGQAYLYAMNYSTCVDAVNGAPAPTGRPLGDGIPTSPVLHESSSTLIASTSVGVSAAQATSVANVATKGAGTPYVKRLYWKLEAPNP